MKHHGRATGELLGGGRVRRAASVLVVALFGLMVPMRLPAHPLLAEPPDYPFVPGFDRFYAPEDDEPKITEGGLLLLEELNCVSCHAAPEAWRGSFPVRGKISLAAVGSRLGMDDLWLLIRSPKHRKPGTLMPGMFAGEDRDPNIVEALATYLASLKQEAPKPFPPGDVARGRGLYHTIGCVACHEPAALEDYKPAEAPPNLDTERPGNPSVPILLADRYDLQALAAFLQDPLSIRKHGRMPATEMTDQEAADIAAYLHLNREPMDAQERKLLALAPQSVEEGRRQFALQRCDACHESGSEDKGAQSKPLAMLQPDAGCLSTEKKAGVPDYGLSEFQMRALKLALSLVTAGPPAPQTALQNTDAYFMRMNCYACHEWRGTGGLEEPRAQYLTVKTPAVHALGELARLPPKLDHAGRKLTSGWMEKLLWGEGGSVRSNMTARMPRVGRENGEAFIPLFAQASRREVPVELVPSGLAEGQRGEMGRVLMGAGTGGLGCVSCHGLREGQASGVSVIDLTHATQRLQAAYFKELLLDPNRTEHGMISPPLFDGRAKAEHEVEMIWTFLKEDAPSPLPEGLLPARK